MISIHIILDVPKGWIFWNFRFEETKVINMGYGFTTLNPYYPIYQFLNMSLEKNLKMFGQHDYLGVKTNIRWVHIDGTFI